MTALYHAYTQTVADGTATSVVRPSDWNSAHVQGQTLSGNTAGVSSFTGTNFVFQGGNNVTLSAATAAGAATIIISGANTVAQTVQTQASGAIAGTGFTSTTTAGTNITAVMGTNGLSMAVPAFLTTYAAQSADTNKAGTGFTSTTVAGTAIAATLGTDGLSMAVPNYLTTSSQSVQTQASGAIAGTGFTSTTTTGTAVVATQGTNGLSMAVPAFITTYVAQTTQTQPAGNIVGAGYTSTTQAGSTVGITQNSNGLSAAWPAFITTATQSTQTQASGAIAGTGFTSTTTAGTAVTAALGTNGLSMAVPAYITTYVNDLTSGRAGTGYTSTTQAGSTVGVTLNTNGLSAAWPPFITTATQSVQTQVAGDMMGTGFTRTTKTGTQVSATLNTDGMILAMPLFVTTYDATSGRAGTGTTLALTNLTGTMNVGTNGVALSLSAGAGGPGGGGVQIAAGGSTISDNTVVFSNANGVSFGLNGSTMTASIVANNTYDGWPPYSDLMMVAGQQGQGTLYIEPEHCPYYFQDRVGIPIAYSNASNSNGTLTLSYWVAFYTQNASTLSLASSTSISTAFTFNGTTGTHWSIFSGMRLLTIPWSLTVAEQELYIAQLSRTTTGGANASISQMLVSNVNSNFVGFFGQSHNTTQQWTQGQGVYSVTTSGMPASIAFSQIRGSDSLALRAPAVMFINSTV